MKRAENLRFTTTIRRLKIAQNFNLTVPTCPLFAVLRPLLGVKQTSERRRRTSAFDPCRTLDFTPNGPDFLLRWSNGIEGIPAGMQRDYFGFYGLRDKETGAVFHGPWHEGD